LLSALYSRLWCFNTASGRHCCNHYDFRYNNSRFRVSIPQAVGTVATEAIDILKDTIIEFQYRKR